MKTAVMVLKLLRDGGGIKIGKQYYDEKTVRDVTMGQFIDACEQLSPAEVHKLRVSHEVKEWLGLDGNLLPPSLGDFVVEELDD